MIEYFEAGNRETDAAAKDILESDFNYRDHWRATAEELRQGTEWSGLRAPEAEIVVRGLRLIEGQLAGQTAQTEI